MPLPTATAPPLTTPPLPISMRVPRPLAVNVLELTTVPVTIALPPESVAKVACAATEVTPLKASVPESASVLLRSACCRSSPRLSRPRRPNRRSRSACWR